MSLLTPRLGYKPFSYPRAYDAWYTQQKLHWLPEEVPLGDDVKDYNYNITASEKHLLTQIFRYCLAGPNHRWFAEPKTH